MALALQVCLKIWRVVVDISLARRWDAAKSPARGSDENPLSWRRQKGGRLLQVIPSALHLFCPNNDVGREMRRRRLRPFAMVIWLTVIFMSFGLFAPRNLTAVAALFFAAFALAAAVKIIIDMETLQGRVRISGIPMRHALEEINH